MVMRNRLGGLEVMDEMEVWVAIEVIHGANVEIALLSHEFGSEMSWRLDTRFFGTLIALMSTSL